MLNILSGRFNNMFSAFYDIAVPVNSSKNSY